MGNWFKKMFGGKCSCDHCDSSKEKEACCHGGEKKDCCHGKEVNKSENTNAPVAEVKADEKVQ